MAKSVELDQGSLLQRPDWDAHCLPMSLSNLIIKYNIYLYIYIDTCVVRAM